MRRSLAAFTLAALLAAQGAAAQTDQPVVIELFTSQGCSSCPPADELLTRLAARTDVIPLALHVDYWDYIGWRDHFGKPAFTKRQKSYAAVAGSRTIYTPQMVIDGVDHVVGVKPMEVADLIQKHKSENRPVDLQLARDGGQITITARVIGTVPARMDVQLVRFIPDETVVIERGENAGRTIRYSNIVHDWSVLGSWDGRAPLSMSAAVDGPVAVIVQSPGPGSVMASAILR